MLFLVLTLLGCNDWHPIAGRTWACEGFHAWLCRAAWEVQGSLNVLTKELTLFTWGNGPALMSLLY